ncbi:MAG TPA: hypothetical protein VJ828_11205 [Lacipirellulaceae bacterium]|nr:hypothetical protein [Lacipirellulaceae bacterium]
MEVLYIAGGGLLVPLFIAVFAIGLLGASVAIEVGALATETVTLRSFPAAWDSRRHKRHAVDVASADRASGSSRLRLWLRFLTAPTIAYWSRWLALAAGGLIVTVVAIPALNVLLFEHCLRLALRGVEQSHGIVVTYQAAEGDWLKGRAELREARLQRQGHGISEFDLTVDRLYVDADAGKVISGEFAIESVVVSNVRGRYTKIGKRDRAKSRRQDYTIDRLTIDDAKFEFVDRSRPPRVMSVPMKLTSLEVDNYRSRWALFDVLFRSQTRGTIYGRPFEITSRATADAHESVFKVADLPLELVGQRVRAPLGGRVDGFVDANIRTTWQDESTDLKMHCSLLAHNFTLYMPNGPLQRAAGSAMASRVPRTMPMEFDLVMNESSFDGQTSLLATGILESIGNEASRQRRPVSSRPRNGVDRAFRRFGSGVRSLVKPSGR